MKPMKMYPLKFEPIFKERIWGGRDLKTIFAKNLPENVKIGESWELADVGEDKSVIANGQLAGMNIAEAMKKYTTEIFGAGIYKPPFPLLIKILDAQDDLSVQVHPDARTCLKMGKGKLKTECWYIIDAKPGAVIYKGLKAGVTKEQFAEAIKDCTMAELLEKIEVEPGQCHFLPAGTPHAIGAGLLIAEIQTPSDTTYRVSDWNRVDESGNPRQLHIAEALESIHFDQDSEELTVRDTGRLVDCDYFKVDKGHQAHGCEMLLDHGKMKAVIILDGKGKIYAQNDDNNSTVDFSKGETLLIPASYNGIVQFIEETYYLTVTI